MKQSPKQVIGVVLIIWINTSAAGVLAENKTSEKSRQVSRGEMIYKKFCAVCHGENLEGQADWRKRKPDGKLPAPPHDETGHTWHHPDEVLFGITKHGLVPPYAPANYKSDMPAWGSTLVDGDIWAVLAYIKSRWPAETHKIQQDINARAIK